MRKTYYELKQEARKGEDSFLEGRIKAVETFGESFSVFVNRWSGETDLLADYLSTQVHRTLQQGIMRFCMAYIREQAKKPENHYDLRNEGTVLLSKFIVEKLKEAEAGGKYYGLPLI